MFDEHKKIKIIYKICFSMPISTHFMLYLKKFITAKAVFVLRLEKMNYVTIPWKSKLMLVINEKTKNKIKIKFKKFLLSK